MMLLTFKTGNCLSFKDVQTFSMVSGNTRGNENHKRNVDGVDVLRCGAIYGANASGKTNLLKSIYIMKSLVLSSDCPDGLYFRLDPDCKGRPSYFEVEFSIDDSIYSYGFEYDLFNKTVIDEWLYLLHSEEENELIFQRTGGKIEHNFHGEDKDRVEIYSKDGESYPNVLFLTAMSSRIRNDDGSLKVFSRVFEWFRTQIYVMWIDFLAHPYQNIIQEDDYQNVLKMIPNFGTGIDEITFKNENNFDPGFSPDEMNQMVKALQEVESRTISMKRVDYFTTRDYRISLNGNKLVFDEILYKHKGGNALFHPDEESSGTIKLYSLLSSIMRNQKGAVYLIDELDSGLHPDLTKKLLSMFLDLNEDVDSQLIFTAHNTELMENNLLRHDEIWFSKKDDCGSSELYSLDEFGERNDRRIEKSYREGRYGARPVFKQKALQ